METSLVKILNSIQKQLKAPKNQVNKYGGGSGIPFNYRNCEDILEALKPLLPSTVTVTITDEIVNIGERYYIKATATIADDSSGSISTTAYAREALDRKGMDDSQITGSASSYARKYALNGLFLIDDTKDADTRSPEDNTPPESSSNRPPEPPKHPYPTTSQSAQSKPSGQPDLITEPQYKKIMAVGKTMYELDKEDIINLFEVLFPDVNLPIPDGMKHLHSLTKVQAMKFIDVLVNEREKVLKIIATNKPTVGDDGLPF